MANTSASITTILSLYEHETSITRMSTEEAIETTEGLIEELGDRLVALRADAENRTRG